MSDSSPRDHKPLFSQTFLGAIIVAVVGGVLVWGVTNNLPERSTSSASPPTISSVQGDDGASASGKQTGEGEGYAGEGPEEEADKELSKVASTETPADTALNKRLAADIEVSSASDNEDEAPGNVLEVNGLRFDLRFCRREGSDIYCEIKVTNTRTDEQVELSNLTRLIDDDGVEHRASHLYYRGETGTLSFVMELATDVPSKLGLRFAGAGKARSIALLEFCCWSNKVQWKGISVSGA